VAVPRAKSAISDCTIVREYVIGTLNLKRGARVSANNAVLNIVADLPGAVGADAPI